MVGGFGFNTLSGYLQGPTTFKVLGLHTDNIRFNTLSGYLQGPTVVREEYFNEKKCFNTLSGYLQGPTDNFSTI